MFLSLQISATIMANTQLVITFVPLLLLTFLHAHSNSVFQSPMLLLYPSHEHSLDHICFVMVHSKNKWLKDSRLCQQNAQAAGIWIPIFNSLSTIASLCCAASHMVNLYLGCIFVCNIKLFHSALGYTGISFKYIYLIWNFVLVHIVCSLLWMFPWSCWCSIIKLLLSSLFLTTQDAELDVAIFSRFLFFI